MARFLAAICLTLLTTFGLAASGADAAAVSIASVGVPPGFGELARARDELVDVYFGGQKVGEARVIASPGKMKFIDADRVVTLIPNIEISPEVKQAFSAEFPTNVSRICPEDTVRDCGMLSPEVVGIIFDEDHFRVDLFVNRKWLRLIRPEQSVYLSVPTAPLSLTSSSGLALSGSNGTSPVYNLQNRTIIGFRNARVRADVSYASNFGLVADTVVAEIDRPGMRYSAGLFWAPGLDLTGQRRIMGAGFGTQFDTRTDRDSLQGTPLVVFLTQTARVDILVDGRLVSSVACDAGNNVIDTSSLPAGSYSLVLRIHDANGAVHQERRFFAKNPQIAPVGQPIFFGYAGVLANTRQGRPISLSSKIYYQVGAARRLSEKIAVDLSMVGANEKPILEAGAWVITPLGRLRAAALASARGDHGALLQIASSQTGRVSLGFDLRRIWSHDGKPLIPLPTYVDTFESVPIDQRQVGNGSYTQASGSIGYQIGSAFLAVTGSLRKDKGLPVDYSIGPNLNWTILSHGGLQITLQADAQATRKTTAGYAGVRMLYTRGAYSVSNSFGGRGLSRNGTGASSKSRGVGDTTAQFSYADDDGTDLFLAGGVSRELDSTATHADAMFYSRFGSARGQILHGLEGAKRTQYGLTLQTGAILNGDGAIVGGRDLAQSAMVISLEGSDSSQFDVLVDGQARGRVRVGRKLPIFLPPYRAYSVKLRPVNAASVWYDAAARKVTLYPGNVQHLRWHTEHLLTVFGRAVWANGQPIADAVVKSRRGIGQSDSEGYFQVETTAEDLLSFEIADGTACKVILGELDQRLDYTKVGRIVCQ